MLRFARLSLRGTLTLHGAPVRMRHSLHLQRFSPQQLTAMTTSMAKEMETVAKTPPRGPYPDPTDPAYPPTDPHSDTYPHIYPSDPYAMDAYPTDPMGEYAPDPADKHPLFSQLLRQYDARTLRRAVLSGCGGEPLSEARTTNVLSVVRAKGTPEDQRKLCGLLSSDHSALTINMEGVGHCIFRIASNRRIRDPPLREAAKQPLTRWRFVKTLLLDCIGLDNNAKAAAADISSTATAGAGAGGAAEAPPQAQFPVSPQALALAFDTLVRAEQYAEAQKLHRSMRRGSAKAASLDLLLLPMGQAAAGLGSFPLLREVLLANLESKDRGGEGEPWGELERKTVQGGRSATTSSASSASISSSTSFHTSVSASDSDSARASSSIAETEAETGAIEVEVRWLRWYCGQLLQQPDVYLFGRQMGQALCWLLLRGREGDAVSVWNLFVHRTQAVVALSLLQDERTSSRAFADALMPVSRHPDVLLTPASLRRCAQFLRSALLDPSPPSPALLDSETGVVGAVGGGAGGEGGAVLAPAGLTFSDAVAVEVPQSHLLSCALLDVFAAVQDVDSASVVLLSSMKQGIAVPEQTMTQVLQLLQKGGEHRLVLDLFELYSSMPPPPDESSPTEGSGGSGSGGGGKGGRVKGGRPYKKGSRGSEGREGPLVLAPYLYSVALGSLVELKDYGGMLRLMTEGMPSRGFCPRTGFYVFAIQALLKNGMYREGVDLYALAKADPSLQTEGKGQGQDQNQGQTQGQKRDQKQGRWRQGQGLAPSPATKAMLVDSVLQCCAG
ncbi:hypothetical protein B484DRAFT_417090, partial [Ochromonadaceae sp. CCMP2298]